MRSRSFLALAALVLNACADSDPLSGNGSSDNERVLKAETVLPPGQSGFFSVAGQAQGTLTGNPADFGEHVDDQRQMYWRFDAKPGVLGTKPGTPTTPISGVAIYRDAYGVPIIYAPNVHDLWYGVGYAIGQDRLFLMDAVRRMGLGTFAELAGCGSVPADIKQRTIAYSSAEYDAFFERLSQDAKDAVLGYVDGANAWRDQVLLDPTLLPAEYGLLSSVPAEFTVHDVLAAGVFITRFVAAEGGNEFQNIRILKLLIDRFGSAQAAKEAFQDLDWLEDPKAVLSVPASVGTFSNQATPAQGRDAVFSEMADWAVTLPETIWKGPGTAHSPAPCAIPKSSPAAKVIRGVGQALEDYRRHLRGGSHAYAIGSSRTADGGTLLVSGPQLGYTYPTLLIELEIHAGPYHARGFSVPILPGLIGYNDDVAISATTGYSKTIDSFIETICSTAQISEGTCQANQYFHDGQWKAMDCRSETIPYRQAPQGVPSGPAIFSSTVQICRTVHGPIVARDDGAGLARSVQYAMFGHEFDTVEGARIWSRARSFADFLEGARQVTWNENVIAATRDGHIAYIHPGRFLRRSPNTDMRLPSPGTGEFDFGEPLSFDELPQAIDPPQGFVANWNNKPALGWLDGEGLGDTSRPGGAGQRVTSILDFLATRQDWTFAELREIDRHIGTTDHRARSYMPVIGVFRTSADGQLSDVQKAALDLMLTWDRSAYGPDIDLDDPSAQDGPAATIFGEYVVALREALFAELKQDVIDSGVPDSDPNNPNPEAGLTIYGRVAGVGSHVFDMSVMDNLVLRILDPLSSGLSVRHDWANGRSRDEVMAAALETALARLAQQYNGGAPMTLADLDKARRVHPRSTLCSLTGVIGPGSDTLPGTSCVTMPYQDRGSWVHRVGYERPD
jgi:penicillin G amidase